jgi:hypothetical protein
MEPRGLYSHVPDYESRAQINPTLLMSWWATGFSLAIIVVRLCGRYIRLERFFPEDKIMVLSIIPLAIRMVLVHFILTFGTNNVQTDGLTAEEISKREIGSKLVLVARIFYAILYGFPRFSLVTCSFNTNSLRSIWMAKLTVCEFLKRVTGLVWRRSVALFLRFIQLFLMSTLIAVVIATLAECQPFDHYWQVRPDPGPSCRSGYANLITMGTCDVITDLLLVAFPVPIILVAQISMKRKLGLVVLFCLSLILVAITCYRVPSVIDHDGAQPYRSLIASLEILAATAVSNAVVIGSFVRDRGVKKLKYKRTVGSASVSESMDTSFVRRNTVMQHQWGSDSDLAAGMGIRLDPKLHSSVPSATPMSALPVPLAVARTGSIDRSWSFHQSRSSDDRVSADDSLDIKVSPHEYIKTNKSREPPPSPISRRVSFFDVGGLLNQDQPQPHPDTRHLPAVVSSPAITETRVRRGSRAFFEDLGVLSPRATTSPPSRRSSPAASGNTPLSHTLPAYRASPDVSLGVDVDVELQDVGGLLSSRRNSNV